MNLLIFTYSFFPKIDGVTHRINNLIKLLRKDYNIVLVTSRHDANLNYYRDIPIHKLDSIYLPTIFTNFKQRDDVEIVNFYNVLKTYTQFKQIVLKYNIDLILSSGPEPSISIYSKILNIPHIQMYNTDVIEYSPFYIKFIVYLLLRIGFASNTKTLFTSKESQKRLGLYGDKYGVIIPYIDIKLFKPNNTPNLEKYILFVGRIEPEKNLDLLFSAVEIINKKFNTNLPVKIVGSGTQIKQLQSKYNINCQWVGKLKHKNIVKYYQNCYIFVNPSITETLGFNTIEAQACGKTVIGFNMNGTKSLIKNNKTGLLINNVNELVNAIVFCYNNKSFCDTIGKNARLSILKYSKTNYKKNLINHINSVLPK